MSLSRAWMLFLAFGLAFSQEESGHVGETFFHHAKVYVNLIGRDSVVVQVGAKSEDLQNTVGVFPHPNTDTASFRLLERKLEAYLQQRVPVWVDGKRIYLKVVGWKPGDKSPAAGIDSNYLWSEEMLIGLGARVPRDKKRLDVRADLWLEREDAADTQVEFALIQDSVRLRRQMGKRERTIRYPVSADSLKAMMKAAKPRKK